MVAVLLDAPVILILQQKLVEAGLGAAADNGHLAHVADEAELVFDGKYQVQRLLLSEVRQRELAMVHVKTASACSAN